MGAEDAGFVGGVGPGTWDDTGEGGIEMTVDNHKDAVWNGIRLMGNADKNGRARVVLSFKEDDSEGVTRFASAFSSIGGSGNLTLKWAMQASGLTAELTSLKAGEHSEDSDDEFVAWLNEVTDGIACPLRVVKDANPNNKRGTEVNFIR